VAVRQRPAHDGARPASSARPTPAVVLIGLAALLFSALYFLSDAVEAAQGGFSPSQLWLTLICEAAVPVFVIGLAKVQGPQFGRLGWASAWAYAYSYVFFTGTVIYALVRRTDSYEELSRQLGAAMLVHGALMVVAGVGFGTAVLRARLLPRWTAIALMAGVVLVAAAFAGMGVGLLRQQR
jgi:hypothetical protein